MNSYDYWDKFGYDLVGAFDNNGLADYLPNIKEILANREGENDGPSYYWVLEMKSNTEKKGKFALAWGWCDYTGWDCQSNCELQFFTTARKAAKAADFSEKGVGDVLLAQLKSGRSKTWREETDKTMPNAPIIEN